MGFEQCVETRGRNGGHNSEETKTLEQWAEFRLQPWVFIAQDEHHYQYGGQTGGNCETGSKDDQRYDSERSHQYFRNGNK